MKRILLFAVLISLFAAPCDARMFGRRRNINVNVNNVNYNYFTGDAQAVCEQKARLLASLCRMFHPGGSFGGGSHEGVAVASDPTVALNSCCYYGQLPCIGAAVYRGSNGMYYACRIYK
jgi:hypothetical protein